MDGSSSHKQALRIPEDLERAVAIYLASLLLASNWVPQISCSLATPLVRVFRFKQQVNSLDLDPQLWGRHLYHGQAFVLIIFLLSSFLLLYLFPGGFG